MFSALQFTYIVIVYCQAWFCLLFIMNSTLYM